MARCLSFHAPYRCRQAGACCHAGWTIPFDTAEVEAIRHLPVATEHLVRTGTGVTIAGTTDAGACVFLASDGLCEIHRVGGHQSLPLSCRMFPRSVLMDPRGTFVSLSHFCPTAAGLLFAPGPPATIVEAPAALMDVGPLDGLDARSAWPPLLRPAVLMDLDSYDAWEHRGVELLTREESTPAEALAALRLATARITSWTPGDGPLLRRVNDAFEAVVVPAARPSSDEIAVKRWLAARLFACWLAYQRDGLGTLVDYLHACFETFAGERARDDNTREAIRRTDFRIMHTT